MRCGCITLPWLTAVRPSQRAARQVDDGCRHGSVRWVGVALYAAGGILRLWPIFKLGHRFSGLVAIQREHRLQTVGVYSIVPHPSYAGIVLILLGWSLVFRSGAGLILTAIVLLPIIARIRAEERLLVNEFGAEYQRYAARTWRLLPFVY